MKLIKTNNLIWGLILSALIFTGCGKSLTDTNINPNEKSADEINPAYIMTEALGQTANQVAIWNMAGNATQSVTTAMMQYTQRDYLEFNVTNAFNWLLHDWNYRGFHLPLANAVFLGRKAKNSPDSLFLKGVSLVLSSYWFGFYTSAWGDVPYSEAIQGPEGIMRPAFDKQPDIFKGILQDLKTANNILKTATVGGTTQSADILYNGDPEKWRAFANSLRLRFLMRLSAKASEMKSMDVDVKAEFNDMVSNPDEYPLITVSSDNAAIGFPGSTVTDSWPIGPLAYPDRSEFYRKKPAATIVNFLRDHADPRLTVWFAPVDVPTLIDPDLGQDRIIKKAANGKVTRYFKTYHSGLDTNLYTGLDIAMPDPNSFNGKDQAQISEVNSLDPSVYSDAGSNPFTSYLGDMWGEDTHPLVKTVLISASEVNFTLAEAVVRGWISGSALEYYKKGIETSLDQYAIADGDKKVYDKATHKLVAFDLNAFLADAANTFNSASNKLIPILTQEWAADFGTADMAAWCNWRRTGIPDLGKNIIEGSNGNKIPVRFMYGNNPMNFNGDNVNKALQDLKPAENTQWAKMWLIQGTGEPW